jgi:hypothetical protein
MYAITRKQSALIDEIIDNIRTQQDWGVYGEDIKTHLDCAINAYVVTAHVGNCKGNVQMLYRDVKANAGEAIAEALRDNPLYIDTEAKRIRGGWQWILPLAD